MFHLKRLSVKFFVAVLMLVFGLLLGMTSEVDKVYATSGACSSHEGVSCNSGSDVDGSVICNDGWTESTVNYYEVDECMDYLCPEQQVLYDALYMISDWSLGIANICEELGLTGYGSLEACLEIRQQELDAQWAALWAQVDDVRYLCYDDYAEDYSTDSCQDLYGVHSFEEGEYCYCEEGYEFEDDDEGGCISINASDDVFSDVASGDEYYAAISDLYTAGVIDGYSDGTYKPDASINRAEFSKILVGVAWPSGEESYMGQDCFIDVDSTSWYAPYVCLAENEGVIDGYPDGSFQPGNNINVVEALKITLETLSLGDVPDAEGEWYQKYLDYAENHDLYLDSWLSLDQEITRGEMAELIYRSLGSL